MMWLSGSAMTQGILTMRQSHRSMHATHAHVNTVAEPTTKVVGLGNSEPIVTISNHTTPTARTFTWRTTPNQTLQPSWEASSAASAASQRWFLPLTAKRSH